MMTRILRYLALLAAAVLVGLISFVIYAGSNTNSVCDSCNCTCNVSWGGHTMSVEDAFERSGEGLTIGQQKEVNTIIEGYLNENNSIR